MPRIDSFLTRVKDLKASDLHLSTGSKPRFRIHGELETPSGAVELSSGTIKDLLYEVMDSRHKREWEAARDVDFAYGMSDGTRFRGNVFQDENGVGAVFRIIPDKIIPLADLNLPAAVERVVDLRTGLVLVTGPTGSGKSTTLAAILDAINKRYRRHIITIEDPIEFVHRNQRSFVSQRELGSHCTSFSDALRSAMRQDPDVILIGELRDQETMSLALTAAEMGALVFATMHTNSAAKTMNRIVDAFPHDLRDQTLAMLAGCLQAVVSQILLRRAEGSGRVVAQ